MHSIITVRTFEEKCLFFQTWVEVWIKQGYAENPALIQAKYRKYDAYSSDFLLIDGVENPLGTLRIISDNSQIGLPVLNDFIITQKFNNEKLCEATLLTINKTEQSSKYNFSLLLLVELWRYARFNRITGIVVAADIRLWYLLTRKLNLCFEQIGESKMYEGSLTVPGYLSIDAQRKSFSKLIPKNILEKAIQEI